MTAVYEAVYGDGTRLKGFSCQVKVLKQISGLEDLGIEVPCGKLCRNQVGMLLHLERKHGVRLQQCLFEESPDPEEKLIGPRGNSA